MTAEQDPVSGFKEFLLFSEVVNDLFDIDAQFKTNLWTVEIAIYNCNLIVDEYLEAKEDKVNHFYPRFLSQLLGGHRKAKLRYCFRLYLSLTRYAKDHQIAALYLNLFSTQTDLPVYNLFWETRKLILELKGELKSYNADLDKLFVNERQWQYVLGHIFNFSLEQIQDFEAEMNAAVLELKRDKRMRTKLYKFSRNEEFCASFFLQHTMNKFYQMYQESLARSTSNILGRTEDVSGIEKAEKSENSRKRSVNSKTVSRESDPAQLERLANKSKVSEIVKKVSEIRDHKLTEAEDIAVKKEIFASKISERDRLLQVLQATVQQTNKLSDRSAKMVATLAKIDELAKELQTKLSAVRAGTEQLAPKSGSVNDTRSIHETTTEFMLPDNDISHLKTGNALNIRHQIKRQNPAIAKLLAERTADKASKLEGLTTRLKRVIFSPDYYLFQNNEEDSIDSFKYACQQQFGGMNPLTAEARLVIDTHAHNRPTDAHHAVEPRVGNVFSNVSENLVRSIDELLNLPHIELNPNLEEFQTFNQTIQDQMTVVDMESGFRDNARENQINMTENPGDQYKAESQIIEVTPQQLEERHSIRNEQRQRYAFLKDPFFDLPKYSKKGGLTSLPRDTKVRSNAKLAKSMNPRSSVEGSQKNSLADVNAPPVKSKFVPDEMIRSTSANASPMASKGKQFIEAPLPVPPKPNIFAPSHRQMNENASENETSITNPHPEDLSDNKDKLSASPLDLSNNEQMSFRSRNSHNANVGGERGVTLGMDVRGRSKKSGMGANSRVLEEKEFQMEENSLRELAELEDKGHRKSDAKRPSMKPSASRKSNRAQDEKPDTDFLKMEPKRTEEQPSNRSIKESNGTGAPKSLGVDPERDFADGFGRLSKKDILANKEAIDAFDFS